MRFLWMPLAKLQEGLGGKTRPIVMAVVMAASIIITGLVVLPYPLKMDSTGKILPEVRRTSSTRPSPGTIEGFDVQPNAEVARGPIAGARCTTATCSRNCNGLMAEMDAAKTRSRRPQQPGGARKSTPRSRPALAGKAALRQADQSAKHREMEEMMKRTNSRAEQARRVHPAGPGTDGRWSAAGCERPEWTVLTSNFKTDKEKCEVKPSEPIMRLGVKNGPWEIELKIPQKHIGQVLRAFERLKTDTLDVDFVLRATRRRCTRASWSAARSPARRTRTRTTTTSRSRWCSPTCAWKATTSRKAIAFRREQLVSGARGARQGSLRRSPGGLFAVLRRVGVPVREGGVLLLLRLRRTRRAGSVSDRRST